MTPPSISCIIPTFNRADLLKNAIESTLDQTYTGWELIIVDDGSTDDTEDVVLNYSKRDNRIKYFKNPGKGGSSARNFGIKQSKGEFIAFLDDDDVSFPHRFESQLAAAEKSGSSFVVSGYEVRKRGNDKFRTTVKLELKGAGAGFPSRWLIKKELLDEAGGFDEDFPSMQEIELSYRLAGHEIFVLHDDIVTILYQTENSISAHKENAIMGKELLMQRLGTKMHPVEAAWWYFTIGQDYYITGNLKEAQKNFMLAAKYDDRKIFLTGYRYFMLIKSFNGLLKKVSAKGLREIGMFRFPNLVKHPVIK